MDLKQILHDEHHQPSSSSSQPSTPVPESFSKSSPPKQFERAQPGSGRLKHASPLSQAPLSNIPSHMHVMAPLQPPSSSPLISPVPVTPGTPHVQRTQSAQSAQSVDTLAELSSTSRPNPLHASSLESMRTLDTASRISPNQVSLTSNPRASFDINMMEVPKQGRRVDFGATTLPQEQKDQLAQLAAYLNENPSAYESHVAYINILHAAFIQHVFPTAENGSNLPNQNPMTFILLEELRFARKSMHKLFAPGETIWKDWLQDESMLANTTEQRIEVIENFRTAVTEEPSSCELWLAYGDWVLECYRWAHTADKDKELDEDRMVGREVFSWPMVQETWQMAIDNTKLDLASSHLVWNKFIETRISQFQSEKSKDQANAILQCFEQRLRVAHVHSATTKSILATWLHSSFSQDQYFEVMEDTGRIMKDASKILDARSSFEQKLEDARARGSVEAEYEAFVHYLEWETRPERRRKVDHDLCDALYRRAQLRFPTDTAVWEDHVAFALESSRSVLDVLARATKHCPWSGSLWAQYLLASDEQGQSYEVTEGIKHRATSTGILEAAGVEEVLKVHAAWCAYLRRRAFHSDHDEDDLDIAEIGIKTSIESLGNLGAKLGLETVPDPTFRLQRIYINFLSESNRWDNARQEFDKATRDYGNSWQFWIRFYHWEMKRWRRFGPSDPREESIVTSSPPHLPTSVLKRALDQPSLDYPEPIIEALINHCEDYESAEEMQSAWLKIKKAEKALTARRRIEELRQREQTMVDQAMQVARQDPEETESSDLTRPQLTKRKRDMNDSDETLHENYKRSRTAEEAIETVEQTPAENPKRDREHATILVENLPDHSNETKLRQYFSSCGQVKAVKLLDNGSSATIEFADDNAAHYALIKDGQLFEDRVLQVVLDTGSTVFVTNYSAETGESDMRTLLQDYGEIISIRFPSLQGNKKRRFCYVQFKLPSEAQSAVNALDNKDINGLKLLCKVSNPAVKKSRDPVNTNDGRTIFARQIAFIATEQEIKDVFSQYGTVDRIHVPILEGSKKRNKGIAFITFSTPEQAQAALVHDRKEIKGRAIRVEISSTSRNNRQQSSVPPTNGTSRQVSASPSETLVSQEPRSERTIFLTNIPDTVNEARLKSVASKSGEVIKVILKTNHQGALIEFATTSQAGEAALAMDGHEIETGRGMRVVSEKEMKAQGPEKKSEGFAAKSKPKIAAPMAPSGIIKRPGQNGPRKGGNLGQRKVLSHPTTIPAAAESKEVTSNGSNESKKKSNADFRALMMGKQSE